MIGVLMSATLPARLGEPARAMVLARRTGRMRETFPVLLGTLVSQTVLNILALVLLGVIIVASTDLFHSARERALRRSASRRSCSWSRCCWRRCVRCGRRGSRPGARESPRRSARALLRGPHGPDRLPGPAPRACRRRRAARGLGRCSCSACAALFQALGLDGRVGIGAAAAVLFAVNVTAVVPATPSNIGVFQLAVISVLTTGFGVAAADALAYGVILQAVEIATAVALGLARPGPRGPHVVRHAHARLERSAGSPLAAPERREVPRTRASGRS